MKQYQRGTHILPYFRAQLALSHVNLILGDIYGGSNHGLIAPLYSPELNLTVIRRWDYNFYMIPGIYIWMHGSTG